MEKLIDNPQICITGLGLITSVGHDVKTACASIRANLKRSKKLDRFYVPSKQGYDEWEDGLVSGHPVLKGDLDDTETRLFSLLDSALEDLYKFSKIKDTKDFSFYISLSDEDRKKVDNEKVKEHFPVKELVCFNHGHAGMIIALCQATEDILSGKCKQAIIAGVDSLIGFDDLVLFNNAKRLKTGINPQGFIPGEAASAVLIEKISHAEKQKTLIKAVIDKISIDNTLVNVIAKMVQDKKQENNIAPDMIISDMNGENSRGEEFGRLHYKILNKISGEKNIIIPAKNLGDTSAAYAGIAIAMTVCAMDRGYIAESKEDGNALILASSDSGARAGVYIIPYTEPSI